MILMDTLIRQKVRIFFTVVLGVGSLGFWTQTGMAASVKKGASVPAAVADLMTVKFDYTLTVDGKVVDSSQGHTPLQYVHGKGQIIPGLERELAGLHVGDSKEVDVKPEDGYGQVDPAAFIDVPKTKLPQGQTPEVGMVLSGRDPNGRPFQAKISEIKADAVTLDMNHPLAGKTLHFKVKVIEISPAPSTPKE